MDVAALLEEVLSGSRSAWQRFFAVEAPVIEKLARSSRSMGSYRQSEDDCRNVMARVFERLRRDDLRALRLYKQWQAQHPGKDFSDWLTIVVTNVIRDYVSEKLGTPDADGNSIKQQVITWASELKDDDHGPPVLPHMTTEVSAHQVMAIARRILPKDQQHALAGWLEGREFAEIAEQMDLESGKDAERMVRAALARLRRHLAE